MSSLNFVCDRATPFSSFLMDTARSFFAASEFVPVTGVGFVGGCGLGAVVGGDVGAPVDWRARRGRSAAVPRFHFSVVDLRLGRSF